MFNQLVKDGQLLELKAQRVQTMSLLIFKAVIKKSKGVDLHIFGRVRMLKPP